MAKLSSLDASNEIEGIGSTIKIKSPSSNVGINVLPTNPNREKLRTKKSIAPIKSVLVRVKAKLSVGAYNCAKKRSNRVSECGTVLRSNDATTGMTVRERINEPKRANTIVIATGAKSFPSSPSSVKSGKKTTAIIKSTLNTETLTSLEAR